jgi:hypothetical protein
MQTFPHLYPNMVTCVRQTLTKEGVVRGLYAGTVPSLAANIGENATLFAAYGGCQKLVAQATGVARWVFWRVVDVDLPVCAGQKNLAWWPTVSLASWRPSGPPWYGLLPAVYWQKASAAEVLHRTFPRCCAPPSL